MNLLGAIKFADELRPNDVSAEEKAKWCMELDGEYANTMGVEPQSNPFPLDTELLMPYPYDDAYAWYICAKVDLALAETDKYAVDMAVAESAIKRGKAWWGRNHMKDKSYNWRIS